MDFSTPGASMPLVALTGLPRPPAQKPHVALKKLCLLISWDDLSTRMYTVKFPEKQKPQQWWAECTLPLGLRADDCS